MLQMYSNQIREYDTSSFVLSQGFFGQFRIFLVIPYSFLELSVLLSLLLFSHYVTSDSLQNHGLHHARLPCPSISTTVCSNSCPVSQWCYPTISSSPALPASSFAFSLSQHQGFFSQWVSSSHQVAKVLELQLQHQSFQWIFQTDFL